MAKKTTVEIVDDMTGDSLADGAGRTLTFAFDGAEYEIDLTNAHIEEFREHLDAYVSSARRVSAASRGSSSARTSSGSRPRASRGRPNDVTEIREWAAKNGFQIATRGRIPANVLEAYRDR